MNGFIEGFGWTRRRSAEPGARRSAAWIAGWSARWITALGLALASAPALVAEAADGPAAPAASKSSWAYDLAGELMSPFCPGRTLASCPSPQAGELIQWIATQEAAGVSRDEVISMLVERHGEEILGAPPAKGITLWAYVFPVLGFVAFGGIAAVVLSRIVAVKTVAAGCEERPPASDELARIVDAELADRA